MVFPKFLLPYSDRLRHVYAETKAFSDLTRVQRSDVLMSRAGSLFVNEGRTAMSVEKLVEHFSALEKPSCAPLALWWSVLTGRLQVPQALAPG